MSGPKRRRPIAGATNESSSGESEGDDNVNGRSCGFDGEDPRSWDALRPLLPMCTYAVGTLVCLALLCVVAPAAQLEAIHWWRRWTFWAVNCTTCYEDYFAFTLTFFQ